tara:strand:+ start:484 stop:888 length:405 start_codon:yes stop_codon:yes gene_type:complete
MKHFKHLLFLSTLCSLVFFTNCTWDNFFWVAEKTMPDDLNIEPIRCWCGEVIEIIPESLTADDYSYCRNSQGLYPGFVEGDEVDENLASYPYYSRVKNHCTDSVLNVCWSELADSLLGTEWCTNFMNIHDFNSW